MSFTYHGYDSADIERELNSSAGDFDSPINQGISIFKPKSGTHVIRVLPATWAEPKAWFLPTFVHYRIGVNASTYLCPQRMVNKPCPICESRAQLNQRGDTEVAKKLAPQRRAGVWMIDRNAEMEGPLVWLMPFEQMARPLLNISKDPRTGAWVSMDDPYQGFDIVFEITGRAPWIKYSAHRLIYPPSPLHQDQGITEAWLNFVVHMPLPNAFNHYDYEYLKQVHTATNFEGLLEKRDDGGPRGNLPYASQGGAGGWAGGPAAAGGWAGAPGAAYPPAQRSGFGGYPSTYGNPPKGPSNAYAGDDDVPEEVESPYDAPESPRGNGQEPHPETAPPAYAQNPSPASAPAPVEASKPVAAPEPQPQAQEAKAEEAPAAAPAYTDYRAALQDKLRRLKGEAG